MGRAQGSWRQHSPVDAPFGQTFNLDGLAEDRVWAALREATTDTFGSLNDNVRAILGYATTEMVNNPIDHSAGAIVSVAASAAERDVEVQLSDDGVGVFARIQREFAFADPIEAVVEITKGKRTTAPDRHSGEGIFFTSKAVDLSANGYRVVLDNLTGDVALVGANAGVALMINRVGRLSW